MAEKYGTIPKRFTKAWWEYFWDYYKIHTIVIALIIMAVAFTVYQVKTTPKYDLNLSYAGEMYLSDEMVSAIQDKLSEVIDDLDGNGEKKVGINQFVFTENDEDVQFTQAMITKLQLEFVTDESMLFVYSEDKAKFLFENESLAGAFLPVSQWLDEDIDVENKILYSYGGEDYGVALFDSASNPYPYQKLYVAVRTPRTNDDEELNKLMECTITAANTMLKTNQE